MIVISQWYYITVVEDVNLSVILLIIGRYIIFIRHTY